MLSLPASVRVFLAADVCDMRRGFDALLKNAVAKQAATADELHATSRQRDAALVRAAQAESERDALRHQLALKLRSLYGRSSEKIDPKQLELFVTRVERISLIGSAKLHEIEPWAYLTDVTTRLAHLGDSPSDEDLTPLLPDRWIAANPRARLPVGR